MAITFAALTSGTDTTDDADSVVSATTVTAERLQLLTICSRADAVQPTISSIGVPTGSGIVWTLVGTAVDFDTSGSRRTLFLYRGMATATVTGGFTITWGGTQTGKAWALDEVAGMDTSGTQGSGAIVQAVTGLGAGVSSLTITLAAFGSTSNATYGAFGNAGEGALIAGTGFTRIGNQQVAGECGVGTEYRVDNDTSVDMSNGTMDIGGVAVEIKAAATTAIKTINGVTYANTKTVGGLAIASVKNINGLA